MFVQSVVSEKIEFRYLSCKATIAYTSEIIR